MTDRMANALAGLAVCMGLLGACGGEGAVTAVPPDGGGAGGTAGEAGTGDPGDASAGAGGGDVDAGGDAPMPADPTVIKTAAARTGRLFGAALGAVHLSEADYAATAAAELSWVTPENEMKWSVTEPARTPSPSRAATRSSPSRSRAE